METRTVHVALYDALSDWEVGYATAHIAGAEWQRRPGRYRVALAPTGYRGADRYVDAPAVTDRGMVTASATAPVEFAREIFRLLDLYEPAVLDAWYKLYGERDPAGFFELVEATSP